MKKVTYIIPIHEFNSEVKPYIEKSFTSIINLKGAEKAEIILTGELDVITNTQKLFLEMCGENNTQVITLLPTEEKDLFKKINFAVSKCKTPYFSILEFDDEYYHYWDTVAQRYTDNQYSVIMPMTEITTPKGEIAGLANEIAWDASFVDNTKLGFIGLEDLFVFKEFITSGAYIKTSDFIELGGLKPELKIAAWYEFLLNCVDSGKDVFIAPRIGYRHTVLRDGSYLVTVANEITREEGVSLINKAITLHKPSENTDSTQNE